MIIVGFHRESRCARLLYVSAIGLHDIEASAILPFRAKPKIFLVGGHRDYCFLVGHCKIIIIVKTVIIIMIIIITIHIMLYRNFRFVCILLCIIH